MSLASAIKQIKTMSQFVRLQNLQELERMEQICCELYKITKEEIYSDSREPHIAWPRFILWYAAVKELGIKFKSLAMYYNRHHTSIMHGVMEAGAREKQDILFFIKLYRERCGKPVENNCINTGNPVHENLIKTV